MFAVEGEKNKQTKILRVYKYVQRAGGIVRCNFFKLL